MQKIFKIVAGFILAIAIFVAAIFMFTGGMVKDTKAFFTALKNNDTAKANDYLSTRFVQATTIDEFKAYFDKSDLADYKDSRWFNRSIENNTAKIEGTISTESGQKIPLTVSFVKESGKWKISAINIKDAGLVIAKENTPSPKEQLRLVYESMAAFANSLEEQSMESFHNYVSLAFGKQFSVDKFEEIFKDYYSDAKQFRNTIANSSPVFDKEPFVNEDNVLTIEGYYPSGDLNLEFDQKYIKEDLAWKLSSFYFEVVDNTISLNIPNKDEQLKLVAESMNIFTESLKEKSMQRLYNHAALLWTNDRDLQYFENGFAGFYDKAQNFENITSGSSPIIEPEATINDARILELKGYYPADDLKLRFEQGYVKEGLAWKLIGFRFKVE